MLALFFAIALAIPVCMSAAVTADYSTVYPYYKMVEEAVTSDPKNLYLLRQMFLPALRSQPWLLDGVHNTRIRVHMDYHGGNRMSASFKQDWEFLWTDSSLLSLVSADELLAFDPVIFLTIYSSMMYSSNRESLWLPIELIENSSSTMNVTDIEDTVKKAVMLFFSWGKAYARSNGVPTLWDEKDQGYIGVLYNYFAIGSPFTLQSNYQEYLINTHCVFLVIFIFLNLLLPVVLLINASNWNKKLKKVFTTQHKGHTASNIFWVTGATLTLFNTLYVVAAIAVHLVHGHPTALRCFIHTIHECTVPKSEYENTFTMEALISKAVMFPVAIATELIAAVVVARKLEIPAPPLFASRICRRCRMAGCFKTFAVWQFFIFVQIVIGLMGIPLTITLVISPAQTTSQFMTMMSILLIIAVLLGYAFSIQFTRPTCSLKAVYLGISFLGTILLIATITAVILQYFLLINGGLSMKGVKGYAVSLLPTILLSLFVWALKRKLMKKSSHSEPPEYRKHKESDSDDEPLLKHVDLHIVV